jgi:carbon monoxide dehydrogenase subunit G
MAIELDNSFTVPVPPEQAWEVLLDVERVAPCMPGASVLSVADDSIEGQVKVKLGPLSLTYKGTAKFVEKDQEAHTIVLDASGKETRGSGTASASVNAVLSPGAEPGTTTATIHTSLNVTGKPAQFGRSLLPEISGKLIAQFADNLAALISSGAATSAAPSDGTADVTAPAAAATEAIPGATAPTEASTDATATDAGASATAEATPAATEAAATDTEAGATADATKTEAVAEAVADKATSPGGADESASDSVIDEVADDRVASSSEDAATPSATKPAKDATSAPASPSTTPATTSPSAPPPGVKQEESLNAFKYVVVPVLKRVVPVAVIGAGVVLLTRKLLRRNKSS